LNGIVAVMTGILTNVFTLHLVTKIRHWQRRGKNWNGESCVRVHCLLRRLV
jgi:DNA-binding ferritin-like protein